MLENCSQVILGPKPGLVNQEVQSKKAAEKALQDLLDARVQVSRLETELEHRNATCAQLKASLNRIEDTYLQFSAVIRKMPDLDLADRLKTDTVSRQMASFAGELYEGLEPAVPAAAPLAAQHEPEPVPAPLAAPAEPPAVIKAEPPPIPAPAPLAAPAPEPPLAVQPEPSPPIPAPAPEPPAIVQSEPSPQIPAPAPLAAPAPEPLAVQPEPSPPDSQT